MTPIHLNRCVRDLRRMEIADVRAGQVNVLDRAALWKLGEFDPAYLL